MRTILFINIARKTEKAVGFSYEPIYEFGLPSDIFFIPKSACRIASIDLEPADSVAVELADWFDLKSRPVCVFDGGLEAAIGYPCLERGLKPVHTPAFALNIASGQGELF